MAYEQKELSGSIFKNTKREKDTHPNMTGSALIGGVEYWVSAWTKGEGDKRWQSLAFKPKDKQKTEGAPSPKPAGKFDDMEDDIPFVSCFVGDDVIVRKLTRRIRDRW